MTVTALGMGNTTNGEIIRDEETGKIKRITQKVNGIDIEEMSKAGSEVIKAQGKPFEVKIEKAAEVKAALDELRAKAIEVEVLAQSLSNPISNPLDASDPSKKSSDNILKRGGVTGTTSDGKTLSTIIGVTNNDNSIIGNSYKIVVKQLASKDKIVGTELFADKTAAANITAILTVNGVDVDIDATMSLEDIQNTILTNVENVSVELVSKDGAQDHYMVLSSTEFAKPITLDDQGSGAMSALGLAESGKDAKSLSAIIMRDVNDDGSGGTEVVRAQNIGINDVISGTIDLKTADDARVITMNFVDDKNAIKDTLRVFRDRWNELVEFYNKQTVRDTKTNEAAEGADLLGSEFAKQLMNSMRIAISGSTLDSQGKVTTLRDFGLVLERGNTLTLDETKLDSGIAEKYEDFKRAAGDYASSTNQKFQVWSFPNEMASEITGKDISISYNKDAGGIETATITIGSEVINVTGKDVEGGYIKGPEGSKFEGLRISFNPLGGSGTIANNTTGNTTIKLTRGAFSKMYAASVEYTKISKSPKNEKLKGLIQKEMDRLDKETTKNEKKVEEIESRAARQLERDRKSWSRVYETMMQYQNLDFMLDNLIKSMDE